MHFNLDKEDVTCCLKLGSFSASSNVTGICEDTHAVAEILHRHGALSFWDYAAAAPYVRAYLRACVCLILTPRNNADAVSVSACECLRSSVSFDHPTPMKKVES